MQTITEKKFTYTSCRGNYEENEDDKVQDEHAEQNEQHFEADLK